MNFASDNWAGAHPHVAAALARAASGYAPAYGTSELDRRVERRFSEIFEREVAVFFVATGTAANSLSMASVSRPGAVAFCHSQAHMVEDECGAPEYLSGGTLRMLPVAGANGRIDLAMLRHAVDRFDPGLVHGGRPTAVSITQSTESGSVYALEEIASIGELCREKSLALHMDGARFANAVAALGVPAAQMIAATGVDVLAFGATKNGTMCADAVVILNPALAEQMLRQKKRAGQDLSKARFLAAQLLAYLDDDLWLRNAHHANSMARRLADATQGVPGIELLHPVDGNIAFAAMTPPVIAALEHAGLAPRPHKTSTDGRTTFRLVTSFATTADEIDRFAQAIRRPGLVK